MEWLILWTFFIYAVNFGIQFRILLTSLALCAIFLTLSLINRLIRWWSHLKGIVSTSTWLLIWLNYIIIIIRRFSIRINARLRPFLWYRFISILRRLIIGLKFIIWLRILYYLCFESLAYTFERSLEAFHAFASQLQYLLLKAT